MSKTNKAIFLDRDGTINIDKHYLFQSEEFEFLPGVLEALKQLQELGFKLVIITNQSGIAKGYYTEEQLEILHNWLLQTLQNNGITIHRILYCPHHPDAKVEKYRVACTCRKPGTSLFVQVENELAIDMERSYAIGDRIRDLSICEHSKCRGILVSESNQDNIESTNIVKVSSLLDAVKHIKDIEEENI